MSGMLYFRRLSGAFDNLYVPARFSGYDHRRLSIPTSVIATFFLMKSMDFTLNNMSLMALSLAVGILIDDAIVLIENIFRHMEMGKSPIQAAQDATEELSLAILATSLSLMAVLYRSVPWVRSLDNFSNSSA
mgnify:CR=1 FL=1